LREWATGRLCPAIGGRGYTLACPVEIEIEVASSMRSHAGERRLEPRVMGCLGACRQRRDQLLRSVMTGEDALQGGAT
jgi:hypothetical protein